MMGLKWNEVKHNLSIRASILQWNAMNFIVDGPDFIQFIGSGRVNSVCGALFFTFIHSGRVHWERCSLFHSHSNPIHTAVWNAQILHLRLCVNVLG